MHDSLGCDPWEHLVRVLESHNPQVSLRSDLFFLAILAGVECFDVTLIGAFKTFLYQCIFDFENSWFICLANSCRLVNWLRFK